MTATNQSEITDLFSLPKMEKIADIPAYGATLERAYPLYFQESQCLLESMYIASIHVMLADQLIT